MNLFFWMVLNLVVPIFGPICTLALVVPAYGWRVAKRLIAGTVKDGQLFWCAVGLCAAAMYEVVTALERGGHDVTPLAICMVGLCLVGFACSGLLMLGSVKGHLGRPESVARYRKTPPVGASFSRIEIGISIFFTFLSTVLFGSLHIYLN